ncbi:unnamed protein product [Cyclocybe aegerita]|uniref:F-box domain-containing protein n=1 Tax=Cyclocybe aegerita TaxID=1973307 RepID=A0A8S0VU96_CYCAE|nr:unnamed protein product [Cyclocybe aegerita]
MVAQSSHTPFFPPNLVADKTAASKASSKRLIPKAMHTPIQDRLAPIQLPLIRFMNESGAIPHPSDDPKRKLSQVCTKWRRIIVGDTSLWANIRLAPVRFEHSEHLLRLFEQSAERSRGQPLLIQMYNDLRRSRPAHVRKVEDLLYGGGKFSIVHSILAPLPVSSRLTSLKCLFAKDDVWMFLRLPSTTFPVLKSVDITFIHSLDNHRTPFTKDHRNRLNFTVFKDHPTLQEAAFHIENCIHPLDLQLPWGQLTKLDLASAPMPTWTLLTIMSQAAPSLVDGAFHVKLLAASDCELLGVTMPVLKRLRLVVIDPTLEPTFFALLKMPILGNLKLERFDRRVGWQLWLLIPVLVHSSSSLRLLELKNFVLRREPGDPVPTVRRSSYTELEAILEVVPRLEELRLAPDIVMHLPTLEKVASGGLVPQLRVLELFSTSSEQVVSMVQQRAFGIGTSTCTGATLCRVNLMVKMEEVNEVMQKVLSTGLSGLIYVCGIAPLPLLGH